MSKPVKNLITESYRKRFGQLDGALLIDIRGVKSNQANNLRAGLARKQVRISVVKNSLARKALAGTKLDGLTNMIDGPSALVFGGDSVVTVAREVIALAKDLEKLQLKGAIMDGQIFGPTEIKALSEYPTKPEAQGKIVTLIFSPAKKVAGQILAPGKKLASLIKAIQEKKEKEAPAEAPAPAAA